LYFPARQQADRGGAPSVEVLELSRIETRHSCLTAKLVKQATLKILSI
jgi:hypothetical protein